MTATIFPDATLDRARSRWEDRLWEPTPVESHGGRLYKREDYFAPLGYGGINGAKLRQLVWIVDRYSSEHPDGGILTGASVLSPQVSMSALVAAHYGLPCVVVLGGSKPETAIRHENVAIAAAAGASFAYTPVGYNPTLQRAVDEIGRRPFHDGWLRIHYGITTAADADPVDVEAFHAVGAHQTANLPPLDTLVMTAGSCNSCVSVLYGIARDRVPLRRVVLLGIGPTRLAWIHDRLGLIEKASGVEIRPLFRRIFHHAPGLAIDQDDDVGASSSAPYVLEHWDLHATKFASYGDRMPRTLDGIAMHPTYEGKAIAYMEQRRAEFEWFWNGDGVLFWIVGSAPSLGAMRPALQ
jgi:1-aminocyclopropane-1-carboxylate deaminase/D-cysteine desulfhydrase-like pyridoxal-dependent ACC family enzyme